MKIRFMVGIACCILFLGCTSREEDILILSAGEQFSYDLNVYGDEENAKIAEQAEHYSQSEIIRDSTTHWGAFYFYTPENGYSGFDHVTIETCTGGQGTQCDELNRIEFTFEIKE